MKSNRKRVVAVLATILLTVLFVIASAKVTEYKAGKIKNGAFFKGKSDYDVLYYGSSHMVDGVYPMEMWKEQGIVSYNLASNGNRIPTSYWVFVNSLDYSSPKLVVLDCTMMSQNLKADLNFSYLHTALDEFPLSVNKIKAVNDILDDAEAQSRIEAGTAVKNNEERSAAGLLWEYSVYHSRWSELTENDFLVADYNTKGAEVLINVDTPACFEQIGDNQVIEENTVAMQYTVRMIEECRKRGIDLLLVYLPCAAGEEEQMEANTMEKIAADYSVNCINFLDLNIINYKTDCYDSGHMNPSGAKKVSNYLGKYILANYDVCDRRNDKSLTGWEEDHADYIDNMYYMLSSEKKLTNYLMLLSSVENRTVIDVRNNKFWKDEQYSELLKNLNVGISQLSDSTDFIVIADDIAVVLNDFEEPGQSVKTQIGEICISPGQNGADNDFCLYNGKEEVFEGISTDTRLHIRTQFANGSDSDICFAGQLIQAEGGNIYSVSEAENWE